MNRYGAVLILVLAAQGVAAEPTALRTDAALPLVNEPAVAVTVKLAEAESRMQALAARKLHRSVEEAMGRTSAQEEVSGAPVELTMGH